MRRQDLVGYDCFWTCNVSIKRQFMLEHGMFDEAFLFNEDVICGHQLDQAGMRLHFVPSARGEHIHQLTLAGLPAKAEFTGRWIFATVRRLPERAVLERYGVLGPELGWWRWARRVARRTLFRVVDNPITHVVLRALGAGSGRRNRWSDLHYGLLFRRWVVAGYHRARREAASNEGAASDGKAAGWHNRGDL
jgi:cellulose synthase/poly-beta-1,6-N-acetylglucosamine synthase-like glycosyltransferase